MKSLLKRGSAWCPFQAICILCGPGYLPTPEESERYWDAKMLSENGIDACTLYVPEDHWWWQQLTELREQAAVHKRYDRYLDCTIVTCVVSSLVAFVAGLTAIALQK